ncbi:hypothetical protein ACEQ8H_004362 [Pleosporales sp. CAS-2024a]
MERHKPGPGPGISSRHLGNLSPGAYQDWDIALQPSVEQPSHHSGRSSDSGSSLDSRSKRSIDGGNNSQRGRGVRGAGRGGSSSGRGERKHSSSSGSSSGQHRSGSLVARGSGPPPIQRASDAGRVDSSITPGRAQSPFNPNGNHPHMMQQPSTGSWVQVNNYAQEYRIQIQRLSKGCSIKQIYESLYRYGNISRIKLPSPDSAIVELQLPLYNQLPQRLKIGHEWKELPPSVRKVPSPVNLTKRYHACSTLLFDSIEFGVKDAENSMIAMHTVWARKRIRLTLNLERKELDIQFPLAISSGPCQCRFRLPIALLKHIYKDLNCPPDQSAIIIPFDSPPQYFVQKKEPKDLVDGSDHGSCFSTTERVWSGWNTWYRETEVVGEQLKNTLHEKPLMDHKDVAIIDLGRWTTYRLLIEDTVFNSPQFLEFVDALTDYGIGIEDHANYLVKDRLVPPIWKLLQEEITGTHPSLFEPGPSSSHFESLLAGKAHLSFPVRYQLEACLSNGFLKEHNITVEFLDKLEAMDPKRAVHLLERVVDTQHVYYDPMEIFKIRTKTSLNEKVPTYCIMQRSAIITPTMIHVASPVMETSNRITRRYAADADRFLRVKFSDERTEGVLRSLPYKRADAAFNRIRRALKNGIVVAGRYYEFLAFGNSQFREHGAYFYAPPYSMSADDIRRSLGNFDHIKTVAKFGARLGQCFSTTRAMRVKVTVVKILDIERNGYNFTDGVGKLSLFLAQMAAQELGLSNAFDDPPSLYQFRLGGCKGVLALDPNITGSEVHIRPSQFKFEADYTGLEIIRSSALATPYFNRQIIVVLSDLGVPDHVFIRKQRDMVNDYERAMTDEDTAISKLRKHIDMNQTTLTMAGMVLDGFMKSRDPFVMSLLRLWRASTIKNLKEKARIAIDNGAFVLGCVDETGKLKGHVNESQFKTYATQEEKLATLPEIFLRIDDTASSSKRGHYVVIEGLCILARNPSLHPGDLRVVRAVNVPALHHLKNVVVLPQTGDRDLASMCSGGDLDGDDYMVLWDQDLLETLNDINVPPMDFTPLKALEKEGPIGVSDISEFFVTYMQNESLGQIAHAHLAQADSQPDGVNSQICLELAELHSRAVDYPKSGVAAQMNPNLRPRKWPHFMEKKHVSAQQTYRSTKVLGKLYDQVQLIDFKPVWDSPFDTRVLEAYKLIDNATLDKAADIKQDYDEALKRLMAKHGIRTEFEAWSVFVLAHNQESRDYKFAEEFGRTIGALKAQYKDACREASGALHAADWARIGPFVAAMYTVTAKEMEAALADGRAKDHEHMPLMSFPWLFPGELGKLATGSTSSDVETLNHLPLPTHHRRKLPTRPTEMGDVGEVETEEGLVHFGELLKLDFSTQAEAQQSREEKKEDEHVTKGVHEQGENVSKTSAKDARPVGSESDDREEGDLQVKLEKKKKPSVLEKLAYYE